MQFGDLTLTPLWDGSFRLDGGAMFGVVPKPLWEKRAPADERNRIRLGLRPLLVGDGPGREDAPHRRRHRRQDGREERRDLRHRPIAQPRSTRSPTPASAATPSTSCSRPHLHFDHAGGFTARDPSGALVPAFPRARYIVRTAEWDDAAHAHERNRASYLKENFVPLADAGVLDLVAGDDVIMPGVRVVRTGGHTKHHQIVVIESGGETAVFAADLMPTTAHVDEAWIMGYDLYPMETLEFKRTFVREAIEREYLIFFEHDPDVAAGYIREVNGRKHVERVL